MDKKKIEQKECNQLKTNKKNKIVFSSRTKFIIFGKQTEKEVS